MALLRPHFLVNVLRHQRHFSVLCKGVDKKLNTSNISPISVNFQRYLFWERHRKGGYDTALKVGYLELIKTGFKELKEECKLFAQEVKEYIKVDPLLIARPGECNTLAFPIYPES